jgi:hypothetical protein
MRKSPLGNIEPRHDLDARRQRSPQSRGHNAILLKKTVYTITDRDRVATGLDMDVGCTSLDRPRYDLVDEPDDRRLVGTYPQPFDIVFTAIAITEAAASPTSPCDSAPAS